MVHMNIFYRMDLQIYDPKSEFWTKTEKIGRSKSWNLIEIYLSKSHFYRKPKWSVWSIWTYSTGWIFKFVTQKVSYGRKLKIDFFFEKLEIPVLGSKIDFWACFQDQNDFKKYSGPFRSHPDSISIYKNTIFNENRRKKYKINLFGLRWSLVPLGQLSGMFRLIFWPN